MSNTATQNETSAAITVTYFLRLTGTHAPNYVDVHEPLNWIREGKLKEQITALRAEVDPVKWKEKKKALPLVCFSGKFTQRNEANMVEHSGLLCLDMDKLSPDAMDTERARIQADPHTFALFASPSGNGLKVLVKVATDKASHRRDYAALVDHYGCPHADDKTKDPVRACFLSWDPELYVNEEAEVFIPPPPLKVVDGIPAEELAEIEERALARAFPPADRSVKMLDVLLEQVEKVDFRELAGLTDPEEKLTKKHFLVCAIEAVIAKARTNRWDLCKNAAFVYLFNGSYWEVVEKDELKTFLGKATERMGVDRFDARYYQFREQLLQQFHTSAHLPTPEPDPNNVLVNLLNGTFEIGTKEQRLRPAAPADFITYQLPFNFDPKATAPMFQAYLDRVQTDKERQLILAECVAYLFINTATLKLEKVPVLYGTGANGKSVFFDVVNALLGGAANVSSFTLQQLTDETGYYRAKLANKLVNYASEINGKMDAPMFKALASGEPVPARLPYGEPFTVVRYAKLMFNCNELPREVEQTDAFFRRFLLVPFDVTIPPEEQDKELPAKIIAEELSGVFNWVLDGLQRLLKQKGYTKSQAVNDALDQYRRRSDSVRGFIEEENLAPSTADHVPLKDFYQRYRSHCQEGGSHPCSSRTFGDRLRGAGFTITKQNLGRVVWTESDQKIEDVF